MKQHFEVNIQPLTAVHIGNGNTLTPMEYLLKKINGHPMYIVYNTNSILNRVCVHRETLREYEEIIHQNNMKSLHTFFQSNFSIKDDLVYLCEVTKGFLEYAEIHRNIDPLDNAQEVMQMYRPEGKKGPVVPGSSLKGAVRTAVLNQAVHDWPDDTYNGYCYKIQDAKSSFKFKEAAYIEKDIQSSIMGKNPKEDIFRTVSFGDVPFGAKDTQTVGQIHNIAVNNYLHSIETKGIPIRAEVLKGTLMGNDTAGKLRIIIDSDLQEAKFSNEKAHYAKFEMIAKACNYFFKREFEREFNKFYKNVDDDRFNAYRKLYSIIKDIPIDAKDTFLIRVGRFSQVEFVTFEPNYRVPKVPKGNGYGETRMVFDYNGQYLPLGWCLCTVV